MAYPDCGTSLVRTARRLPVHRNTVVYRLGRAEQQLGRGVTRRPQELQAALLLAARGLDAADV